MISFQTRWVLTKTHTLKIGLSAKLSLSRISKKKNMHRSATDTVQLHALYDHKLFVDFFTLKNHF